MKPERRQTHDQTLPDPILYIGVTPSRSICDLICASGAGLDTQRVYSQPPGGGLRLIVPWPSGMRAVGLGLAADLPLFERSRAAARGVDGRDVAGSDVGEVVVGDVAATEAEGVTGFMRRPLRAEGAGSGDWARGDCARGD